MQEQWGRCGQYCLSALLTAAELPSHRQGAALAGWNDAINHLAIVLDSFPLAGETEIAVQGFQDEKNIAPKSKSACGGQAITYLSVAPIPSLTLMDYQRRERK
jgi:hypothetical protein